MPVLVPPYIGPRMETLSLRTGVSPVSDQRNPSRGEEEEEEHQGRTKSQ